MGWYYGFKLYLIISHRGEIVTAKVTAANKHDTAPVDELTQGLSSTLYGDKCYISAILSNHSLGGALNLSRMYAVI